MQGHPDIRVAAVADRQHGVVTIAQLRAAGLGNGAVAKRVKTKRLHRVRRGVYAVGRAGLSWEGECMAAVLAIGAGAVVSHRSAAAMWGMLRRRHDTPIEVTVDRIVRSRPGVVVHTTATLEPRERTTMQGIPVTRAPRTLLDLAEVADDETLKRALGESLIQGYAREPAIREQLARAHGRRGAPRLAALVADGPAPTRSVLEDRMLALIKSAGLPRPQVNARIVVGGRRLEVDFLFADRRLVVEADGELYHGNRIAHANDLERQALLEEAGYRVMRVIWAQVNEQPARTAARLRQFFSFS